MNTTELGKRIKEARIAKKMTQSEVVGTFITRNMLSQIESGTATPSVKTLSYLSKTLEIPLDQLLPDTEETHISSKADVHQTFEDNPPLSKCFQHYLQGKQQYLAGDYANALLTLETCLTETAHLSSDRSSVIDITLEDETFALLALTCYQSALSYCKDDACKPVDDSYLTNAIATAKKAIQYSSKGLFANTELKTKSMLLLEELLNRRLTE